MSSFNLIEKPFIPCLRTDGGFTEYGLRDVLVNAHDIAEVRDASPLVTVALHRLLLAILHRGYAGPKDSAARIAIRAAGRFDATRLAAYFEEWKKRFDLFHDTYPFYQRAGFKTAEPSGVNRLAQELSRGNNAALFDHTTDDPPPALTPARAARAVVAEQSFAVGGGKSDTGSTTHAPLVSGAVVLIRGGTLFESLWLNLTVFSGKHPVASLGDDAPVWERPPADPHSQPARPQGYLDYLTWQSRTLRLHHETENEKVVVRRVSYAQGRRLEVQAGFYDPMVAYFRSDKDGDRAVRFNEFRDLWRESASLFQFAEADQFRGPTTLHTLSAAELGDVLPRSARYKLAVFGLCTDKAKVNFWRHESLPLPLAYLDKPELVESLKLALKLAEQVGSEALRKAAWVTVVARLTGDAGGNPDKGRVAALVESFAPERLYWSRLERPYRKLLVELADPAADRAALVADWFFDALCRAAWRAFDGSLGRIEAGRNYKAAAVGERVLGRLLKKVQRAERIPDRETKEGAA